MPKVLAGKQADEQSEEPWCRVPGGGGLVRPMRAASTGCNWQVIDSREFIPKSADIKAEELPPDEAERAARDAARRLLTTP